MLDLWRGEHSRLLRGRLQARLDGELSALLRRDDIVQLRLGMDSPLIRAFEADLAINQEHEARLRSELLEPIARAVESGSEDELCYAFAGVGTLLPVSLSGTTELRFLADDQTVNHVPVGVIVWPGVHESTVGLVGPWREADLLGAYFHRSVEKPLGWLSLVETWMVHGPDHWFVRPSVWSALPPDRRERIMTALLPSERSILFDCEFSILNELRSSILEGMEDAPARELRKLSGAAEFVTDSVVPLNLVDARDL